MSHPNYRPSSLVYQCIYLLYINSIRDKLKIYKRKYMENLDIKSILINNNFRYSKALGQNFITDTNLLNSIVADAKITKDDTVVEIGTGAGTLTRALCKVAKKVITFEVDDNLRPILAETTKDLDNLSINFYDVLKLNDDELNAIIGGKFKVVANLPYYITTPLIMRFIESELEVESLTLMMQKEVALRMTAKENTADYGAITVSVKVWGEPSITRIISKNLFYPVPKVDSALLHIEKANNYAVKDMKKLKKLVKCAFTMRRKTLANNLISGYSYNRSQAEELLTSNNLPVMIRGEALSVEQFVNLSEKI